MSVKRREPSTELVPADIMIGQTAASDDALIRALMLRLPPPGTEWPEADRQTWLGALRQAFSLIYREG